MFRRVLKSGAKTGERVIVSQTGSSSRGTVGKAMRSSQLVMTNNAKSSTLSPNGASSQMRLFSSLTRPSRSPLVNSMSTMAFRNTHSSSSSASFALNVSVATASIVMAVSLFSQDNTTFADGVPQGVIDEADKIYDNANGTYSRQELLEFMQSVNREFEDQPEILWRLARAYYEVAMLTSTADALKTEYFEVAYNIIKNALNINPDNYKVQQWLGILLGKYANTKGTKAYIQQTYNVKTAFSKAAELNPNDPTARHLLGLWCFEVASLGWMTRKLAETFFATPPSSSYEEALEHLLQAEKIEPGFYIANQVLIAECFANTGNNEEAQKWFKSALALDAKTDEDVEYQQRAANGLKSVM